MFFQSLTWCVLKRGYLVLKGSVKASFFLGAYASFCDWISRTMVNSGVYSWLDSNVLTEKYYETSCFYKNINTVWNLSLGMIRNAQLRLRKLFRNSLCLHVYDSVRHKLSADLLPALFLGGMFTVPHEKWNNLYFVLAAGGFGLGHMARAAAGKGETFIKPRLSVMTFMLALLCSTLTAAVPADALRFFLFLAVSVLCACLLQQVLDTGEKLVRFIKILLLFVTVAGILGIVQRIQGVEINLEFVDIKTNSGMPGRVFSTFSNPNNFAQLLVLFMPFFAPAILFSGKKSEKILLTISLCIVFISLLMTYSRSSWVGFAISAVLFVCIYDKRWMIPLILFAVMAVPFLPETVLNRIFTIGSLEDSSNAYRLYIWRSCLSMIKDFGITGLGLGPASFRAIYTGYASPVAVTAPHSHTLYLQLILETGVLGAASFLIYILGVVKQTAGAMRYMSREMKCYGAAGISALSGISFVCCAEYIWFYPRVMFAFWILPGLLTAMIKLTKKTDYFERIQT